MICDTQYFSIKSVKRRVMKILNTIFPTREKKQIVVFWLNAFMPRRRARFVFSYKWGKLFDFEVKVPKEVLEYC